MRKCYKCSGMKYDIDSEMLVCKSCKGSGKKEILGILGFLKDSSNCNVCHGQIYSFSHECE